MDRDIMTPEANGISRREMLIGAGILAAGYGVGQLAVGTDKAYADAAIGPFTAQNLHWPVAWSTPATFEAACQLAAVRGFNQFVAGGG
ncbi:MAG: hypothetical protein KGZ40_00970 [Clostridiales bacterium]|nr:hypothetical protein [Clostridiales bacterium]